MRKILLFALCISFITLDLSAQTKTDKAKRLIKVYMNENLDDISSYSPVNYSSLDSAFTQIEDNEGYQSAVKELIEAHEKITFTKEITLTTDVSRLINEINSDSTNTKSSTISEICLQLILFKSCQSLVFTLIETFKPQFIGWKLEHKYRAKNSYGAFILHNDTFLFDEKVTKIISVNTN
jgi:hypothetical protein